mmetsp:Transcript_19423/g.33557  ORF Transcript_19423/g.33557 Transcript_19423/m.33557 type:complete len:156 (+) Transcript_19423:129-596(+)
MSQMPVPAESHGGGTWAQAQAQIKQKQMIGCLGWASWPSWRSQGLWLLFFVWKRFTWQYPTIDTFEPVPSTLSLEAHRGKLTPCHDLSTVEPNLSPSEPHRSLSQVDYPYLQVDPGMGMFGTGPPSPLTLDAHQSVLVSTPEFMTAYPHSSAPQQ